MSGSFALLVEIGLCISAVIICPYIFAKILYGVLAAFLCWIAWLEWSTYFKTKKKMKRHFICKLYGYELMKDGTAEISTYYARHVKKLVIPETLDGHKVVKLRFMAFLECEKLTSVTIPEGVTCIGGCVFRGLHRLTSVTIPASISSIGDDAFRGCENLTLHVPANSYAEAYAKENGLQAVVEYAALTRTVTSGMHRYRQLGEDSTVYFVDENRGIQKTLVDSLGRIQDFPGIVEEDFWVKKISGSCLEPQIHFRTVFEKRGEGWIMLWTVQPGGSYWSDIDGFGVKRDKAVILYTFVDGDGNFTDPFRIYSVGWRRYGPGRNAAWN